MIRTLEKIESLEREIYREVNLLPNDINGESIVNLARLTKPDRDTIQNISNILEYLI
jgi:hypothetical protein